jgi:hypothetical protein
VGATARCLVVDDDGTVRHALTRVIQGHGLATIEAGSGAEALAILEREGEIPLCISDVHMAEMDGVTFLWKPPAISRHGRHHAFWRGRRDHGRVPADRGAGLHLEAGSHEEVRAWWTGAGEAPAVLQNRFYQKNSRAGSGSWTAEPESLINGADAGTPSRPRTHTPAALIAVARTLEDRGAPRLRGRLLQYIRLGAELHDIGKIGTRGPS